ncbi:hypothetical protein SAMD00019534_011800 [Acytostelium subglobosum LB1]|uniref:hypothetical protein n=1 Tax=Acytostelium subglobosum LB1 TaxID=1410327 RepID=UPI000644B8B8|nr:hypothetical protein SAMD00019534_011800 [Acytostelium subglobosum LB1]GAM18005.1 hypothetical protein SAMD00019534_011800 [Acytostelium subglobosum LB1]|eukprot:XP_012758601.1 hypothetical protein SAMD00019534_011800 [Acytostelium subglobosum LB1]
MSNIDNNEFDFDFSDVVQEQHQQQQENEEQQQLPQQGSTTHQQQQQSPSDVVASAMNSLSDWELHLLRMRRDINNQAKEERKKQEELDKAKLYAKQDLALQSQYDDWMDTAMSKTFAREINNTGSREFVVIRSYEAFWKQYYGEKDKYYNEVIAESDACHLYLDVEYMRKCNPHLDGRSEQVIDVLIKQMIKAIDHELHIKTTRDDVLDLDSSTPAKFSRHLIWHIQGHYFSNNIDVGRFVKHFIQRCEHCLLFDKDKLMESQEESDKDMLDMLHYLLVRNDNGATVSVIDGGVYTKNRTFRLFLSSKFGKNQPLLLSKTNTYPLVNKQHGPGEALDKEVFMASLVCNVDSFDTTLVSVEVPQYPSIASPSKTKGAVHTLKQSSHPKLDEFIKKYVNSRGGSKSGYIRNISQLVVGGGGNDGDNDNGTSTSSTSSSEGTSLLIYNVAGNRWCDNIGREHKSNNIYFEVNPTRGVLYQKCMDNECKGYRSSEVPIASYLSSPTPSTSSTTTTSSTSSTTT